MDRRYTIRLARADDLDALPDIERAASALFADTPYAAAVEGDATTLADFAEARAAGHLWVAAIEDRPVGFAFVELVAGCAHLDELDVHPEHGRSGIGAALVEAVCRWARGVGHPALTLTTYRDVPWNAPFYASRGFEAVPPEGLHPDQRALVAAEARIGLRPDHRVFMRRPLDGGGA